MPSKSASTTSQAVTSRHCPECGGQVISCGGHKKLVHPRLPWNGKWWGVAECQEFGWYSIPSSKPDGPRWVSCPPGTPDATEDLNRLITEAKWDPEQKRFVLATA